MVSGTNTSNLDCDYMTLLYFLVTVSQSITDEFRDTEHLIVLVRDIFDRGFVHELVDHYGVHVSESVWVKINF